MDKKKKRLWLVNYLRLLASRFEVQAKAHPDFVVLGDELALSLEEALLIVGNEDLDSVIGNDAAKMVKRLENMLDELDPFGPAIWDVEAVKADPKWEDIRVVARQALALLGEKEGPPDLTGVTYVQGRKG